MYTYAWTAFYSRFKAVMFVIAVARSEMFVITVAHYVMFAITYARYVMSIIKFVHSFIQFLFGQH